MKILKTIFCFRVKFAIFFGNLWRSTKCVLFKFSRVSAWEASNLLLGYSPITYVLFCSCFELCRDESTYYFPELSNTNNKISWLSRPAKWNSWFPCLAGFQWPGWTLSKVTTGTNFYLLLEQKLIMLMSWYSNLGIMISKFFGANKLNYFLNSYSDARFEALSVQNCIICIML